MCQYKAGYKALIALKDSIKDNRWWANICSLGWAVETAK